MLVFYCVSGANVNTLLIFLLKLKIITWNVKHGGDKCECVFFYSKCLYTQAFIFINYDARAQNFITNFFCLFRNVL